MGAFCMRYFTRSRSSAGNWNDGVAGINDAQNCERKLGETKGEQIAFCRPHEVTI